MDPFGALPRRAGWGLLLAALLCSCTITRHVQPVPPGTPLSPLCIEENDAVWSKEFLPMLRDELAQRGIATTVYRGSRPADCRYHLTYTANWYWDVAVYLKYADLRIYDGDALIGQATYDARDASARMDKFGRTFSKIDPLLDELLRAAPGAAPPPAR